MISADFAWLNFDTEFTVPNQQATRTFEIDEEPAVFVQRQGTSAEGFLLIQAQEVGNSSSGEGDANAHRILINGKTLPSFDMVNSEGWNLWMNRIPSGFLRSGNNTLTIRRRAVDQFRVVSVVVQWRDHQRRTDASKPTST